MNEELNLQSFLKKRVSTSSFKMMLDLRSYRMDRQPKDLALFMRKLDRAEKACLKDQMALTWAMTYNRLEIKLIHKPFKLTNKGHVTLVNNITIDDMEAFEKAFGVNNFDRVPSTIEAFAEAFGPKEVEAGTELKPADFPPPPAEEVTEVPAGDQESLNA